MVPPAPRRQARVLRFSARRRSSSIAAPMPLVERKSASYSICALRNSSATELNIHEYLYNLANQRTQQTRTDDSYVKLASQARH